MAISQLSRCYSLDRTTSKLLKPFQQMRLSTVLSSCRQGGKGRRVGKVWMGGKNGRISLIIASQSYVAGGEKFIPTIL